MHALLYCHFPIYTLQPKVQNSIRSPLYDSIRSPSKLPTPVRPTWEKLKRWILVLNDNREEKWSLTYGDHYRPSS